MSRKTLYFLLFVVLFGNVYSRKNMEVSFKLYSPVFKSGEFIPQKYTCEGENISPQLGWDGVPFGTKSFALICDDPDAPTDKPFVHWLIYNIKGKERGLPANVPMRFSFGENYKIPSLRGVKQGRNDFNVVGYKGPCPRVGKKIHNYRFILYALNKKLKVKAGTTKEKLLKAMKGAIIGKAILIGRYRMQK